MDSVMLEKIKDLLAKNEKIGIAVGKNPGVDEMAGALSLYLALIDAGKKAAIICPTDPIVEISSLVGIDKVKKSFDSGASGDLTVSFPDKGDIEKISYTRENGLLNIIVKAGENGLSFNEKDIEFRRGGGAPGLIFVVGTPRLSDLGTAFDMEILKDSKVVNIDYKPENQGFGDIPLLGQNASSVSELVANFISSLNLKTDIDIASNLLLGIVSATDNFQTPNTSALAFETAASLLKKGAVRKGKTSAKQDVEADSFFTPASNAAGAKAPSFSKTTIGTPARNASQSDAGGEEKKEDRREDVKLDENNPPDDWLAPKIYKGSTSV